MPTDEEATTFEETCTTKWKLYTRLPLKKIMVSKSLPTMFCGYLEI